MRRPLGQIMIVDPDRPLVERDTTLCCHCGKILLVKPGTAATVYLIPTPDGRWLEEPGASCWHCLQPVCPPCHDLGVCRPLERWLTETEAAARAGTRLGPVRAARR